MTITADKVTPIMREGMARTMTAAEIAESERLVQEWRLRQK